MTIGKNIQITGSANGCGSNTNNGQPLIDGDWNTESSAYGNGNGYWYYNDPPGLCMWSRVYEEAMWWNITQINVSASLFDEETFNQINSSWTLQIWPADGTELAQTINLSSGLNATAFLTIGGLYNFRYSAPGYAARNWWYIPPSTFSNLVFYDVLTADSSAITYTVTNGASVPLVGYTVTAYIKVLPSNTWQIAEQSISDTNGQGALRLQPNTVQYKFVINDASGRQVFASQTSQVIAASAIYFVIPNQNTQAAFWNLQSAVTHSISFDNSSSSFFFSFTDSSNSVTQSQLAVYQQTPSGSSIVCTSNATGASGTMSCNIAAYINNTNFNYHATGNIYANSTWYQIDIADHQFPSVAQLWGMTGVFIALMIVLTLSCMGLWNPSAALVFAGIGIIIDTWLGLIPLSSLWLTGILALIAIAVWRLRA
jgi:hypothetical protein